MVRYRADLCTIGVPQVLIHIVLPTWLEQIMWLQTMLEKNGIILYISYPAIHSSIMGNRCGHYPVWKTNYGGGTNNTTIANMLNGIPLSKHLTE